MRLFYKKFSNYLNNLTDDQRHPAQESQCDGEREARPVVIVVVVDALLAQVQQRVAEVNLQHFL